MYKHVLCPHLVDVGVGLPVTKVFFTISLFNSHALHRKWLLHTALRFLLMAEESSLLTQQSGRRGQIN